MMPRSGSATVVVVGASLGGLRVAEQLRSQGFGGRVVVVGDEPWMPYNRPPLSKEALLDVDETVTARSLAQSLAFRPRAQAVEIDWRLGSAAVAADLEARTVALRDGSVLPYDALVVATGLRPRRLPLVSPSLGRHTVRTVSDVVGLRREVRAGVRAVVVGGGFIGCETASTLHALGAAVTVVEPQPAPMVRGVGTEVGNALLAHHRAAGVTFVTGQGVAGLEGHDRRVTAVTLDDGTVLPADVVVEALGSHANVEWLAHTGVDTSDGLICDNHLRVEGRPEVVAVGDVARFPNPRFDDVPRRVEHWCIPGDTAKRAAATVVAYLTGTSGAETVFAPLPTFWSDQFGLRLQSSGAPGLADDVSVVERALDDLPAGTAVVFRRAGVVVGVLLLNVPAARHAPYRALLASATERPDRLSRTA